MCSSDLSVRARSKRDGDSSVASIEAEPSRMTTRNCAGLAVVAKNGRVSRDKFGFGEDWIYLA